MPTCLCMISLRVSATKLVNKNEPEEIPKEFPSRRELAMNYTRCCSTFIYEFTCAMIIKVH